MIKAIFFDMFGTLVDWRGSIIDIAKKLKVRSFENINWELFVIRWRLKYNPVLNKVNRNILEWNLLDVLHRKTLDEVIKEMKIESLSEKDCEILVNSWHKLKGWKDSKEGLKSLKNKYATATLSNANVNLQKDLIKENGFEFDFLFSAEHFRKYKPAIEVYTGAASYLNLETGNCALVASHKNDLYAAAKLGFKTIFIERQQEYGNYKHLFKENNFEADIKLLSLNNIEMELKKFLIRV